METLLTASDIETIGLFYESVSQPNLWPEVLDRIARSLNGGAAVVVLADPQYSQASIAHYSPTYSAEDVREYQDNFARHDRAAPVLNSIAGTIITDSDVWPNRDEFYSNPLVQWRRERFGLLHSWGMNLNNGEGWKDALLMQCASTSWPMDPLARAKAGEFFPHIARAIRLMRLSAIVESRYRQFLSVLDHLDVGVVLLGHDADIVFMNTEAHRISEERGCIRAKGTRLHANEPGDDIIMRRGIEEAIAASSGTSPSGGGCQCILHCRDGKEPCLFEVTPLRDRDYPVGAFVTIIDPRHRSTFRLDGLGLLFNLSDAELAICDLLSAGLTNNEIAEARGTAPTTVKAQLANALAKTGAVNRTALLRLIFKINPPFVE